MSRSTVIALIGGPLIILVGLLLLGPEVAAHYRYRDAERVAGTVLDVSYAVPASGPRARELTVSAPDVRRVELPSDAPRNLSPGDPITVLVAPDRTGRALLPERLGWGHLASGLVVILIGLLGLAWAVVLTRVGRAALAAVPATPPGEGPRPGDSHRM
ncbi:DUF3592 domain-containing protein [Kitasatospora sp. NPDC088134]|uniref:DUF3592 domain-containing protein n=1 Tax=Kitasatospora sp. NPDC088134 TaxID=3364071 RepID=UPI00382F65CA